MDDEQLDGAVHLWKRGQRDTTGSMVSPMRGTYGQVTPQASEVMRDEDYLVGARGVPMED